MSRQTPLRELNNVIPMKQRTGSNPSSPVGKDVFRSGRTKLFDEEKEDLLMLRRVGVLNLSGAPSSSDGANENMDWGHQQDMIHQVCTKLDFTPIATVDATAEEIHVDMSDMITMSWQ